jgi:hypothetical protein
VKFNHETLRSAGVVISLLLSGASFYFTAVDRIAQAENISIRAIPEQGLYPTRLYKASTSGLLYYLARYNITLSNNSGKAASITDLDGVFYDWSENGPESVKRPLILNFPDRLGHTFQPINLSAWQSQLIQIIVDFPIPTECAFPELSLDHDLEGAEIATIFAKHRRTFPICRDLEQPRPFHIKFSGPYFTATTSSGAHYRTQGFEFQESVPD